MGLPAWRFVEMSTSNQTITDVKLSRGQTIQKKSSRGSWHSKGRASKAGTSVCGASCIVGNTAAGPWET